MPDGLVVHLEKHDDGSTDGFCAQAFGFESNYDAENPRHRRIAEQVRVHGYEPAKEAARGFVVVLEGKDATGDVILARLEPQPTLRATVEAALAKLSLAPDRLGHGDWLRIPVFDFLLSRSYRELVGKRLLNPGLAGGMPVVRVLQSVRFRLNENGADLQSRTGLGFKSCCGPELKFLIFEPPFLVLLKERQATRPYFALWVANNELLVRQES
ncbi:MAG: hypothetical protein JW940_28855 [Polyangiaceae bacterium]|nr:hypothetical protein [Polyangiaceae bacterium]